MTQEKLVHQKPTAAFIGASWLALLIGMGAFLIGLWNANIEIMEKGFYFTILLFGVFSVISVQKTVRDRAEDLPVTNIYYGIAWFCVVAALTLLAIGLWNAEMTLSEKGFYGVSMTMALFAVTAVQKNIRDLAVFEKDEPARPSAPKPAAVAPPRPPFSQD